MTHVLPLLLALACASDPAAAVPDAEAVEVHDFVTLKPEDAARLEGRRAVYRVRVAAAMTQKDGRALYHVLARGLDQGVLTLPNDGGETAITVEAELRLDATSPGPARLYVLDKARRRP
jgi:hypothetical protein